ncbi:MAG TPA: aspartate kinase [Chthonomonadaceae bacterium]|nr:aspartate kinase [Chthonomonadaceae bacterium]
MKILVQKFGGTSVDRPEHRALAARKVIKAREAGFHPVVVVSAIGRAGAPYATDTLIKVLQEIDPQVKPAAREMDMMMACGEIISTVVFAHTLQTRGFKAIALSGGQAGIITTREFGNARILEIRPHYIQRLLEQGYIPVVCGFQGITQPSNEYEHGAITTLGRGGSDTTGSALGAALKAVAVEIYTDVDGVRTADPNLVPGAYTLPVCTYEEVAEMAHQGAKVIHPRAAEIAMDYNIPLWVKSTFSEGPGTRIAGADAPESVRCRLTGITHTGQIVYIRLEIENAKHKPQIECEVYRMMARAGVNIYLVTYSPTALSFAVPRNLYSKAQDLLDGMVVPVEHETPDENGKLGTYYIFKFSEGLDLAYSVQRPLLKPVERRVNIVDVPASVVENCTMVSVIASNHRRVPGVVASIFETLTNAGIAVHQTADSEMSISCLVPESEGGRAVRLLHERLFEQ